MEAFKVRGAKGLRFITDEETDLDFRRDRDTLVKPRHLRCNSIKKLLIDGRIQVTEGVAEFDYKREHFKFEPKKEVLDMENEMIEKKEEEENIHDIPEESKEEVAEEEKEEESKEEEEEEDKEEEAKEEEETAEEEKKEEFETGEDEPKEEEKVED